MVRDAESGPNGPRSSRGVVYGEAARRFMLRSEATALAAVVFLFIVFTVLSPKLFPTTLTYVSIMSVAAELGIVSIGVTLLMIGGHFDLSVGAVLGLTSFVCVTLMRDFGLPPYVAAPAAVLVGACLGAVNGAIVVRFRIHSFVVTLGAMLIWRGVTIALTGGFPMTVPISPAFKALMSGTLLGGFRMSMLWFFVIGLIGTFLLVRTRFGNWIQARGQNEQAARNLGVPVDRVTLLLFMLASSLAAVAGVIQVARFSSVDALRGEGIELQAVAVTVIGGTLLSGGFGSVIGTVLGAITFGMIQVGLVLAGAPGHFFRTLTGLIVVGAVILNTDVGRRLARSKPLAGFRRSSEAADAGWETDFTYTVPANTPSGVYAARLRGGAEGDQEEYLPFYVRAPASGPTADIVFLAPTASYMAYAVYRLAFGGDDCEINCCRLMALQPHDEFLARHPELGSSLYDLHGDGSGVA